MTTPFFFFFLLYSCDQKAEIQKDAILRHHVIFNTDANNEIVDQHALAYLLLSGDAFAIEGITVNATTNPEEGGMAYSHVSEHYAEAKRIMQLWGVFGDIPLLTGVTGSFIDIKDDLDSPNFDGHEAVNFIIEQSLKKRDQELILLPVGPE